MPVAPRVRRLKRDHSAASSITSASVAEREAFSMEYELKKLQVSS